jgi:hypothetical protein
MFVSQTSQVLAPLAFSSTSAPRRVPLPLMAFACSSRAAISRSPAGRELNIIFVTAIDAARLYARRAHHPRLLAVLLIGSPWVYFVMR